MRTLRTRELESEQIEQIADLSTRTSDPAVRGLLIEIADVAASGCEVIALGESDSIAPAKAAKLIGMSRTHLYKLLDRGDVPSFYVGTHRRIYAADLIAFSRRRDADRKQLAEKFANQRSNEEAAVTEIANLL